MRFNKVKRSKASQLGWDNPCYQHKLREEGIESNPEKFLEVMAGERLGISCQCVFTAQKVTLIQGGQCGQQVEEVMPPLCSRSHPWSAASVPGVLSTGKTTCWSRAMKKL